MEETRVGQGLFDVLNVTTVLCLFSMQNFSTEAFTLLLLGLRNQSEDDLGKMI